MTYQRTWRQDAIAFWPYSFTDVEESTHHLEALCHLQLLCDRNHLKRVHATRKAAAKAVSMHLSSTGQLVFNMPAGITLPQFDRMEWHQWAGILEALLTLHKAEDMFDFSTHPNQVSNKEWSLVQRRTKAYLCLYVKQDIYSLIASNVDFPTFKHKFDRLRTTYSGASG